MAAVMGSARHVAPGVSALRARQNARVRDARPRSGRFARVVTSAAVRARAHAQAAVQTTPLTKADPVEYLRSGSKPKSEWRCARARFHRARVASTSTALSAARGDSFPPRPSSRGAFSRFINSLLSHRLHRSVPFPRACPHRIASRLISRPNPKPTQDRHRAREVRVPEEQPATDGVRRARQGAYSISHWSPYDRARVVNADP